MVDYLPQLTHVLDTEDHFANVLNLLVSRGVCMDKSLWVYFDLSSDHLPVFARLDFAPMVTPLERYVVDWL